MSAQGLVITVALHPEERQRLEPLMELLGVQTWEELIKTLLHSAAYELLHAQEGTTGGRPAGGHGEASRLGAEPLP